jgi:ubiquinone/menaquinone biosynthesis C-methylase UbiE
MDLNKIISLLRDPITKRELSKSDLLNTNFVIKLLPSDKNTKLYEHYENDAEIFDYFDEKQTDTRLRQTVVKKLGKIATDSIIMDIGSGGGWIANELIDMCDTFFSVDISEKNLSKIHAKLNKNNHYPIQADVMHLPFADDSIDYIISSAMIEHIPDPERAIHEMYRILKPNGILLIETPYKEKIKINQCIHCNKPTPANAHLHSFDEKSLSKLANFPNANIKFHTFRNKLLLLVKADMLLKFMPFWMWQIIDKLASVIINKKQCMIMVVRKQGRVNH